MKLDSLIRDISVMIWKKIELHVTAGERVNEVSITDFFWEQLYVHSSQQTIAAKKKLEKPESVTGADLELWLVDEKKERAIGIRIQAKIINVAGNRYPQLSHKVKSAGDQTSILLNHSMQVEKMIPLYVFYNYFSNQPTTKEEYGMTFAYAHDILDLKNRSTKPGDYEETKKLEPYTSPFHIFFSPPNIENIANKFKVKAAIESGEINSFYRDLNKLPSYAEEMWKSRPQINHLSAYPSSVEYNNFSEEKIKKPKESINHSYIRDVIKSINNKFKIQDKYNAFAYKIKKKNASYRCVDFPKDAPSNSAYIVVVSLSDENI